MTLLTGIGKIFNGVKYDFPLKECIESVLEGADEFILVVCEDSEDSTVEFCRELEREFGGRLKLLYDKWRISPTENYVNMVRLANKAIDAVRSDWFWSVDMDEVMPVGEAAKLRDVLPKLPPAIGVVLLKFNHLYATLERKILGKLYDQIHRVARRGMGWQSGMDGCGLMGGQGREFRSEVQVNHYGFVRDIQTMVEKETRFQQELFVGVDGLPDQRLLDEAKNPSEDIIAFYDKFAVTDKIIPYDGPSHQPSVISRWGNRK